MQGLVIQTHQPTLVVILNKPLPHLLYNSKLVTKWLYLLVLQTTAYNLPMSQSSVTEE